MIGSWVAPTGPEPEPQPAVVTAANPHRTFKGTRVGGHVGDSFGILKSLAQTIRASWSSRRVDRNGDSLGRKTGSSFDGDFENVEELEER